MEVPDEFWKSLFEDLQNLRKITSKFNKSIVI